MEITNGIIKQHNYMTHCMDIMFVNDIPILTGVDRTIRYQSPVLLISISADNLFKLIDKIFSEHKKTFSLI